MIQNIKRASTSLYRRLNKPVATSWIASEKRGTTMWFNHEKTHQRLQLTDQKALERDIQIDAPPQYPTHPLQKQIEVMETAIRDFYKNIWQEKSFKNENSVFVYQPLKAAISSDSFDQTASPRHNKLLRRTSVPDIVLSAQLHTIPIEKSSIPSPVS